MQIKFKRGTWIEDVQLNLVLQLDEIRIDTISNRFKVGDGKTLWTDLPYTDRLPLAINIF